MELLVIGCFARLTGLSVRAVRHYGELGLLKPAHVDPDTGYRYYSLEQVADAEAIGRLRSLDVGLDDIREILEADDAAFTRARLIRHRATMADLAAGTEQILATLQRLIEGEEELVPTTGDIRDAVEIKEVPAQPVLVIRERVPLEMLPEAIPAAIDEVHAHLEAVGAGFVAPPLIVCPFPDDEGMVDLETGWPVDGPFPGGGRVEFNTLAACTVLSYLHRGHYRELGRSYAALQALVEQEWLTLAGAPREIYTTDPKEVSDPADWVTEIQLPIVRDEDRMSAAAGGRTTS